MSKYQTPMEKKEEFRRYLQTSGAISALTQAMVNLFEEEKKPEDATNFLLGDIQKQLGVNQHQPEIVEQYKQQLEELSSIKKQNKKQKEQVKEMTKTIEALRKNLIHLRSQQKRTTDKE
jgi:uncharacterized protein (DUF3084 family)